MVSRTLLTISGAASVLTPLGPIGQFELSMSMVCLARKPAGVLVLIFTPGSTVFDDDADGVEQLQTSAPASATAATETAARRYARPALGLRASPGNVQHNLELQQRRSGRDRIRSVSRMRFDGGPGGPRLERLFGLPLCHHEIPVLTLYRPQQLKPEKSRLGVDGVCPMGESFF